MTLPPEGFSLKEVPGQGPLTCEVAIIGEAPGKDEDRMGMPFVGWSGNLLNKTLSRAGIIRSQCYVSNVIKHRPPKNDPSSLIDLNSQLKIPRARPEWYEYMNVLKDELQSVKSNVIIATGNVALFALTCSTPDKLNGKRGITKYRGSILECGLLNGRKVIPIIHPAATVKKYIFQRMIELDMLRIRDEREFPEIIIPERNLMIEPSFEDAMTFLHTELPQIISVDIEVSKRSGKMSCFSVAMSPNRCMSIPLIWRGGTAYFTLDHEQEIMKALAQLLSNPNIIKVFHNAIFDMTFLFRDYGIRTVNFEDTMVAQGILSPDLPKGLDFCTSIYTKEPYYKDEGKVWKDPKAYEDHQFWIYNAKDSAVTLEVWLKICEDLKRQGNWETYFNQRDIIEPLQYPIERGMRVNLQEILETSDTKKDELIELEEKFRSYTSQYEMEDINPHATQQCMEYFYIKKGAKVYINRKTQKATLDKTALKRLSRQGHVEAGILLEIRKIAKLKSTYLDINLDEDNRFRCSFNSVGTKSGRLSSSTTVRGTGTNFQNQPKEIRTIFLADEKYMMYEIDLSQAENRCVAYLAPEPRLIQAFEEGIDIHSLTAALMFNIPYEQIIEEDVNDIICDIGRGESTRRFWGKKSNHSFDYGEGANRFSLDCEIPLNDAKYIWKRWHGIYPGIQTYWAWVKESLRKDLTLVNPYGRRRTFLNKWGEDLFKEAYSFLPQSIVADKINREGLLYIHNNQDLFAPLELLNQVHDSIVFQIPLTCDITEHFSMIKGIVNSLETPVRWRDSEFVIPCEVKAGIAWGSDMEEINFRELSKFREDLNSIIEGTT